MFIRPAARLGRTEPSWWRRRVAANAGRLQSAGLFVLGALFIARFAQVHAQHPLGPDMSLPATAWFGWADQAAYFLAAHGWASGDLAPAHHLYPAGYALLAAPFVWVMPGEPFFIPNILCWLAALWLFAALAARLGRGMLAKRLAGGLVFFAVTVLGSRNFYTWEIPWTSTPAAVLAFAALLAALRCADRVTVRSAAMAAGLAGGLVLFRPTDAMVLMAGVGAFVGLAALRQRRPAALAGAALGFAIGPALLLGTHWLTHGWTLGYYFENSRLIGFEWRLLPLRWVTLVLSPIPLFPAGDGLQAFFPYILPGIAGIGACIALPGRRLAHAFVGGSAVAFLCLYLCYRDLHVQGLNQFMNYHYFKWVLPLLALYALNLAHLLACERRLLVPGGAIAAVLLLSVWRVELLPDARATPAHAGADGRTLVLPGGLGSIDSAVLVPSPDDYLSIYFGRHELRTAAGIFAASVDFKLYPVPFGFMLVPLRLLGGQATLTLASPFHLHADAKPVAARQRIKFGLPCIMLTTRATCQYHGLPRSPVMAGE